MAAKSTGVAIWKQRAREAERALIEQKVKCASEHAAADRVCGWIHEGHKRKPANAQFTSGPERDIAYMVEWMLTKYDKKP